MIHAQTRYFIDAGNKQTVLHYVKNVLFPLAAKAGCKELQTCILPDHSAFIACGIWPSRLKAEQFADQIRYNIQNDLEKTLRRSPVRELFELC